MPGSFLDEGVMCMMMDEEGCWTILVATILLGIALFAIAYLAVDLVS